MLTADNSIVLQQLQQHIINDNMTFNHIHSMSLSAPGYNLHLKQLYTATSECNSDKKQLYYEYVQVNYADLSWFLYTVQHNTDYFMSIDTVIQYCNIWSCLFQRLMELHVAALSLECLYQLWVFVQFKIKLAPMNCHPQSSLSNNCYVGNA